jgi:putative RNA 2'-phosphotransferase
MSSKRGETVVNSVKLSKTLSYILRHHPKDFGLKVEVDGSVDVEELIGALKERFPDISYQDIKEVVEKDKKGRFSFLKGGERIRANYGHSIKGINPEYKAVTPPEFLYHGTARRFKASILKEGLKPMGRNFTHLSKTIEEAVKVGKRRDPKPVVFRIKALEANRAGHVFYRTGKGIYLTHYVPVEFLELNVIRLV